MRTSFDDMPEFKELVNMVRKQAEIVANASRNRTHPSFPASVDVIEKALCYVLESDQRLAREEYRNWLSRHDAGPFGGR